MIHTIISGRNGLKSRCIATTASINPYTRTPVREFARTTDRVLTRNQQNL
jgi:hypothetical protein